MDKKLLAESLKSLGLHTQAKPVWLMHPLLEQMATQFAGYAGSITLAENGKPLLGTAIKDALTDYRKAGDDDRLAISAFTRSLIKSSEDVFAQRVVVETERGEIMWSPFVSGLNEFVAAYPGCPVNVTRQEKKIPTAIATAFMMTKILPYSLLDAESLSELLDGAKLVN